MDPTMDLNSAVAVTAFAFLYGVQLVCSLKEKREMRADFAARIAKLEDDRRAMTAAALQATNPVAAGALRRPMRVADEVEANPVLIEGLS